MWPYMINFTEKVFSAINKKSLVNLAPKLTLCHFHWVSKKLKTKVYIFSSFGQILFFYLFFILVGRCLMQQNHATFRALKVEQVISCRKFMKFLSFMRTFNSRFESLWKWYHFDFGAKLTRTFLLLTDQLFSGKFVI